MSRQSINILIFLVSVLILVGLANIYFLMQEDRHIMTPVQKEDMDEMDYEYTETDGRYDATDEMADKDTQEEQKTDPVTDQETPPTTESATENQAEKPAENQETKQQEATPQPRQTEIDIDYWLERSIPLTFESRTETSEDIRKQYAHVVEELERVRAYLKEGDHSQAMALLRPMMWDRSNIYREDAEWYYILALISAGNKNTAIEQLNRLLRDNIHLYYFLGRELHEELVPISELIQRQVRSGDGRAADGF